MRLWKLVENRGDLPAIDTIGSHVPLTFLYRIHNHGLAFCPYFVWLMSRRLRFGALCGLGIFCKSGR